MPQPMRVSNLIKELQRIQDRIATALIGSSDIALMLQQESE